MGNPLVSIALATYNGSSYLALQMESIFQQDYQPIEVIVVDDCSSDSTPALLEQYAQEGKIKFFRNSENLGYVRNFERAMQHCSGIYIALADQDDIWKPNKISSLIQAIGSNTLIHSDAQLIDEKGRKIADSYEVFARKMVHPRSLTELLLNGCVTGCTSLVHQSLLEKSLPIPKDVYIHDKWLGVMAYLDRGLVYHSAPLIAYRQHSQNSIGVSRHKSPFSQKFKNLLKGKKRKPLYQPFRTALVKEYQFLISLQEKKVLGSKDEKAIYQLKQFYYNVLTGRRPFKVIGYLVNQFCSFEVNKPLLQKLYFFYLISLAFKFSIRTKEDSRIEIQ